MAGVLVSFTLSGRPLAGCEVVLPGAPAPLTTDHRGVAEITLQDNRAEGIVRFEDEEVPFTVIGAAGLRELRVDLRVKEQPIDDPQVLAVMPSDRYLPLRLLGRGGVGSVYLCRDRILDRLVAVKILNEDASAAGAAEAFLEEARKLAAVEHEHLIRVHDFGIHQDRPYLITEYIDGPSLAQVVQRSEALPAAAVAAAGVQLARGLRAIHRAGLVHQDVKPGNGLVDHSGRVWLADFGLVRHLDDVRAPRHKVSGTPGYMSPELIQGQAIGPASDIYALGATLYHLATGRPPFSDEIDRMLVAHVSRPVPDLGKERPDLPDDLVDLIRRMLAKEPEARPAHDEQVATMMQRAAPGFAQASTPYQPRLPIPLLDSVISGDIPPGAISSLSGPRSAWSTPTPSSVPLQTPTSAQTVEYVPGQDRTRRTRWIVLLVVVLLLGGGAWLALWWSGRGAPPSDEEVGEPARAGGGTAEIVAPAAGEGSAEIAAPTTTVAPAIEPATPAPQPPSDAALAPPAPEPTGAVEEPPSPEIVEDTTPEPERPTEEPPTPAEPVEPATPEPTEPATPEAPVEEPSTPAPEPEATEEETPPPPPVSF